MGNIPEGYEKAEPGEMEHAAVNIDGVEDGDGAGFAVDGVDLRLGEKEPR